MRSHSGWRLCVSDHTFWECRPASHCAHRLQRGHRHPNRSCLPLHVRQQAWQHHPPHETHLQPNWRGRLWFTEHLRLRKRNHLHKGIHTRQEAGQSGVLRGLDQCTRQAWLLTLFSVKCDGAHLKLSLNQERQLLTLSSFLCIAVQY